MGCVDVLRGLGAEVTALARAKARYAAQPLVEPYNDVQYWELVGGRVRLAAEPRTRRDNLRAAIQTIGFAVQTIGFGWSRGLTGFVGFDWPSAGNVRGQK